MFSLSLPGNIEDIWLVCLVSEFGEFCAGGGRSVAAGAGGSVVSATGFAVEEGFDSDEPKEK